MHSQKSKATNKQPERQRRQHPCAGSKLKLTPAAAAAAADAAAAAVGVAATAAVGANEARNPNASTEATGETRIMI